MRVKTRLKAGEGGSAGGMTADQMETILAGEFEKSGLASLPETVAQIDTRVAAFEQRLKNDTGRIVTPGFWGAEVFANGVPDCARTGISNRVKYAFSAKDENEAFPGQHAAQAFRCAFLSMLSSKTDRPCSAEKHALALHGEDHPVYKAFAVVDDQLRSDRVAKIGVTIMDRFLPGLVEFLRPRNVFLAASPLSVPLEGGKATYIVQDEGATAAYVESEDSVPDRTSVSFAERALVAKILKSIIVFSLRAMERSSVVNDAFILNDMLAGAAAAIDDAALLSDGTLARPKGLKFLIDSTHAKDAVVLTTGLDPAARIAEVITDIRFGKNLIANANIDPQRMVYFMSWSDRDFFAEQRTNDGSRAWPSVEVNGSLGGIPIFWTTRITTTGDPAGIGSTLILVDMAEVMFAEEERVNVRTSMEASITDGSGQYNLFERSAGAMLLEAFHDIQMRRSKAGFVWNDLNWGRIGAT